MGSVYGVFRLKKYKISSGGGIAKSLAHSFRVNVSRNVDTSRMAKNEYHLAKNPEEVHAKIKELWEKADGVRSDSVGLLEAVVTTTGRLPQGSEQEFIRLSVQRLKKMFGDGLVSYAIHRDEKETHIHAFAVPLEKKSVEKRHLSRQEKAKLKELCDDFGIAFQDAPKKPKKDAAAEEWEKYKADKKSYEKFKAELKKTKIMSVLDFSTEKNLLSCQKFCGGREVLRKQQDLWHEEVFSKFGLERGQRKKPGELDKYRNPTSIEKWAETLEQKEAELTQLQTNVNLKKNEVAKTYSKIVSAGEAAAKVNSHYQELNEQTKIKYLDDMAKSIVLKQNEINQLKEKDYTKMTAAELFELAEKKSAQEQRKARNRSDFER